MINARITVTLSQENAAGAMHNIIVAYLHRGSISHQSSIGALNRNVSDHVETILTF